MNIELDEQDIERIAEKFACKSGANAFTHSFIKEAAERGKAFVEAVWGNDGKELLEMEVHRILNKELELKLPEISEMAAKIISEKYSDEAIKQAIADEIRERLPILESEES